MTARVRVESATAGLMVRSADERNGLLVDLRGEGAADLWRRKDGGFTLLRSARR